LITTAAKRKWRTHAKKKIRQGSTCFAISTTEASVALAHRRIQQPLAVRVRWTPTNTYASAATRVTPSSITCAVWRRQCIGAHTVVASAARWTFYFAAISLHNYYKLESDTSAIVQSITYASPSIIALTQRAATADDASASVRALIHTQRPTRSRRISEANVCDRN
jgi:hypothetical protein